LGLGKSLTGLGLRKFKKPWAWACPTKFSTPDVYFHIGTCHTKMCCTNFKYSKVSLEAVNKPFYGFSQYMCNSVEVVKNM
jgi:hypothetical protein